MSSEYTIPEGFVNSTNRGDVCPSVYSESLGVKIFIDKKNPKDREEPNYPRFAIYRTDEDGEINDHVNDLITQSEQWDDILSSLEKVKSAEITQDNNNRILYPALIIEAEDNNWHQALHRELAQFPVLSPDAKLSNINLANYSLFFNGGMLLSTSKAMWDGVTEPIELNENGYGIDGGFRPHGVIASGGSLFLYAQNYSLQQDMEELSRAQSFDRIQVIMNEDYTVAKKTTYVLSDDNNYQPPTPKLKPGQMVFDVTVGDFTSRYNDEQESYQSIKATRTHPEDKGKSDYFEMNTGSHHNNGKFVGNSLVGEAVLDGLKRHEVVKQLTGSFEKHMGFKPMQGHPDIREAVVQGWKMMGAMLPIANAKTGVIAREDQDGINSYHAWDFTVVDRSRMERIGMDQTSKLSLAVGVYNNGCHSAFTLLLNDPKSNEKAAFDYSTANHSDNMQMLLIQPSKIKGLIVSHSSMEEISRIVAKEPKIEIEDKWKNDHGGRDALIRVNGEPVISMEGEVTSSFAMNHQHDKGIVKVTKDEDHTLTQAQKLMMVTSAAHSVCLRSAAILEINDPNGKDMLLAVDQKRKLAIKERKDRGIGD